MAAKKAKPRLDDYISKKQLAFIVSLATLIASHYLGWPEPLVDKVINVAVAYLGVQGTVDLALTLKGAKTR